ncbi:MAG: hypothetical protein LBL67_06095 [Coriobacteriales bacterium]|jgi:exopolyphosphatase/guanosine-5'-triphosphate,3'-diphosphate pyrophosphatase|nr:hypothetical protein [Coriobacteriales bacterium]
MIKCAAAVDIGTVTCRLLIAQIKDGQIIPQKRGLAFTQLGRGRDEAGNISAAAEQRLADALRSFKAEIADLPCYCFATSAMRTAPNGARIAQDMPLPVHIIDGQTEAALSFAGTLSGFSLDQAEKALVIDVGGGSTEFAFGTSSGLIKTKSHPVGARVIVDKFADPQGALPLLRDEFRVFCKDCEPDRVFAVAGTATSVVAVRKRLSPYDPEQVHGTGLRLSDLFETYAMLSALSLPERRQVPGLEPERAEVILGGLITLIAALQASGKDQLTVSETDILQGALQRYR